ncbi:MAG: YciI family protein [Bacteroidota bacterium]
MRKIFKIAVLLMICTTGISVVCNAQETNKTYNEQLAKDLKADDYGMKMYVMVILKSGPVTGLSKATQDSIFTGHMANINRLASEGKLIVAGPLGKNDKNYRGIFIFDVENVEAAKLLVATDPVIKSKIMEADYFPWYCSAALNEIPKIHKTIEKKSH